MSRIEGERPVRLLRGPAATEWLGAEGNRAAWRQLHAACPWGTVFQGPAFADAWYESYATVQEPVVVVGQTAHTELAGLLLLARDRLSGTVAHVGSHQAEYQAWLARPATSAPFITQAMESLRTGGISRLVNLTWLAPGTPLPDPHAWRAARVWPVALTDTRGLVDCATAPDSLKKKSNRSRLNRLARLGPVRLRRLHGADDLEALLPTISAFVDFRQAAVHGTRPFNDDPRKAGFHIDLMTRGLLHATVLECGDELVAAHVGAINGDTVLLGLIAHSPFHAAHSPGKLLLHMLVEQLRTDGFRQFDLTPGDDYKLRFATGTDQVTRLTLHATSRPARRARLRRAAAGAVRTMLRAVGTDPARVRAGVRGWARAIQRHPPPGVTVRWRQPRIPATSGVSVPALPAFATNRVSDLLAYRRAAPGWPAPSEFLEDAAQRLAAGQRAYTLLRDGELQLWAWERRDQYPSGEAAALRVLALPRGVFGRTEVQGLVPHFLAACLRVRVADPDAATVPVIIESGDGPTGARLRELGWELVSS